jgi:hypothetical protein
MPAIITNKFRIYNCKNFYNSFSTSNYYLGIGHPETFSTSAQRPDNRTVNEGSDSLPILPVDSVQDELYSYKDLLAVKKADSSTISYVIPKIQWYSGITYDYYRHDYGDNITDSTNIQTANSGATNLYDANFYVINSSNQVYKCLFNNNNSPSTVQPTGTSTTILTTSDGYIWKYMYTLSGSQQINFSSIDFMAVQTDNTVSLSAVDGAIHVVTVKAQGSNGTDGTYTNIPIKGDGSNGKVSVTVLGGNVISTTVTTPGSGYTYAYILLSDIITAGATGLTNAQLDCIIEPKGGHGYDAVTELGGFYVMINVNLVGSESANGNDFTINNAFRKVVLIKDPKSNGSPATATTLRATNAVRFAASPTPGTFIINELITQSTTGATGICVDWDPTNRILYYIQTRFVNAGTNTNGNKVAFSGINIITGSSSNATGTPSNATEVVNNVSLTSGYSSSEIDAYSGDIIYNENRAPIQRASDQTENIKLIVEF